MDEQELAKLEQEHADVDGRGCCTACVVPYSGGDFAQWPCDAARLVAEVRRLHYVTEAARDVFRDGVAERGGFALEARLGHLRSVLDARGELAR